MIGGCSQGFGEQSMKLALLLRFLRDASSHSYIPPGCSIYSKLMLRLLHECHPTKPFGCLWARHPTIQMMTFTNNLLFEKFKIFSPTMTPSFTCIPISLLKWGKEVDGITMSTQEWHIICIFPHPCQSLGCGFQQKKSCVWAWLYLIGCHHSDNETQEHKNK